MVTIFAKIIAMKGWVPHSLLGESPYSVITVMRKMITILTSHQNSIVVTYIPV